MEKIYDLRDVHYYQEENIESKELIEMKLPKTDYENNNNILFHITDTNAKILLSEAYTQIKWKIVKDNGNPIGEENVTGECGLGLFKGKKLTIGKTEIEHVSEYYPIIQQVSRLGEYTPDYSTSQPTNMFCYFDSNDTTDRNKFIIQDDGNITATTAVTNIVSHLKVLENDNYNEGFDKRWQITKDSNTVTIWLPLKQIFDFLRGYPKVFSGFEIKIEFYKNSSENMLYTDNANPNYKVEIVDISLFLPYIKFKNSAEKIYAEQQLSADKIDIHWNQYEIYRVNTIHKDNSGVYYIPASSDEILRLFVVPQYLERSDNLKKNNMIFDNLDMIECWFTVNGISKPHEHYVMDFTKKEYNRLYEAFLETFYNTNNTETGCMTDYLTFGKLYPIICFNLSYHEDYTSLNNLRVGFHYKLRNQTTKDYIFYIVTEVRKRCVLNMTKQEITMIKTLS